MLLDPARISYFFNRCVFDFSFPHLESVLISDLQSHVRSTAFLGPFINIHEPVQEHSGICQRSNWPNGRLTTDYDCT
jgi:hypothetical protein